MKTGEPQTDDPADRAVIEDGSAADSSVQPSGSPSASSAVLTSLDTVSNPLLDELVREFFLSCRAGRAPTIDEFEQRMPEQREQIRALFPTIATLERLTRGDSLQDLPNQLRWPERRVIGDFRLVREIGRGGMGIVYEAIQTSLGRRVALKLLATGIANSPKQLRRFRREAESAARLHHTNIVPVYGIGEEEDFHFYAMQFIDGVPLSHVIAAVRQRSSATDANRTDHIEDASQSPIEYQKQSSAKSPRPNPVDYNEPTVLMNSVSSDGVPARAITESREPDSITPSTSDVDASSQSEGLGSNRLAIERQRKVLTNEELVNECFGKCVHPHSSAYFQRIARIGLQVASALEYAHRHGVMHRDIKPSNLMLDHGGSVWVMDFGLVKVLQQQDLTVVGEIVGTVRYMAPEQLEGRATAKTDIYSLGLTLFELLTLRPAFEGEQSLAVRLQQHEIPRPRSINAAIPRDLETIVLKATSHDPTLRYSSAGDLAEDLRRFCEDQPILARRISWVERLWRWSRRNPALATTMVSTVLLLGVVDIVATTGRMKTESALRLAESNLESAVGAFDSILENVTSRGVPRSMDDALPEWEKMQAVPSSADVQLLDQLLQFYRQFAIKNADNVALRSRTATAHRRTGSILVRLGQLAEAEQDYRTAVAYLLRILQADPTDQVAIVHCASTYNDIGELSLRRGEFQETFIAHLESRAMLKPLIDQGSRDPDVRFEFARATDLFASIDIRSGSDSGPQATALNETDFTKSENSVEGAVEPISVPPIFTESRGREQQTRTVEEHRREVSTTSPRLEVVSVEANTRLRQAMPPALLSEKTPAEGLAIVLQEAAEGFRSLVEDYPNNQEYRFRLAQCLRHRLVHAASTGVKTVAEESFCEATGILEDLRSERPNDPKYLYELAKALTQAGRAEPMERARISLEHAVSYAERLATRFPSVTEYQLALGVALARRAAIETESGAYLDAEVDLNRSLTNLQPLADQFSDQGVFQIPLAQTSQQLGDLLRSVAGNHEQPDDYLARSRATLEVAIERFEGYLAESSLDARKRLKGQFNRQVETDLYKSLAQTLAEMKLPTEAAAALHKAERGRSTQ